MTRTQIEITSELLQIANDNDGLLRVRDVVERAKDERSKLHRYFDWDDSTAGEKYRRQQARQIVRTYAVEVQRFDGRPRQIRAFVSLVADRSELGGGYRRTVEVLSDGEMTDRLLAEALEDVDRLRRRYARIANLLEPVFDAATKLRDDKVTAA